MNELHLQDKFLVPFFTTNHGVGLGYREVMANTVSNSLMIEDDLIEFLKTSTINHDNFKKLRRKFNSEAELTKALLDFLLDKAKDVRNMALFLNQNKGVFTFEGLSFYIFNRSDSTTRGDADFDENIFSVVQELPYIYKHKGERIFSFRPDISLFVNGIYLGYCELKSNYNNQTASKNGRGKVIKDYQKAVIAYFEHIDSDNLLSDSEKFNIKKDFLKVFEKAIWISTTDINETFIIRDISKFFDEIKSHYDEGKYNYEQYQLKVLKSFKPYPLKTKSLKKQDKLADIFTAHYAKKMVEKEILYFNFIERGVEVSGNRKSAKNERGYLISPRPKQKFGVDKIMAKIDELLDHENEPDYFINKLEQELQLLSESKRDELINKRLDYQNNKNIYSLLLQYAAGFGKSNIIVWSALQLKDFRKNGKYVYDKVMLIVDRVQLRDQLDTKIFNMNIDNSMYLEAVDRDSFQKALKSDIRIVIVNLQKFSDIQAMLDKTTLQKLANLRVVFLIDEIHRSNSGSQNQEMVHLFDEMQNSFDTSEPYKNNSHKKNLIIGFTATPSDHTLARFGEYNKYAEGEKIWVPFDSYTMKEAIIDGYILNPLKGIITISAKMYYEMPDNKLEGLEDKDEEKKYRIRGKNVYENEDRIDAISEYIAANLVQTVYKKIRGTAKAMLATSSIKAAKIYKEKLEDRFNKITQEAKYQKYKDAPIYIVYSVTQDETCTSSLNNGLTEPKVLQAFARDKNALIIVVDKLQTGFDEPKLHTLFLDKEVSGINAIQTISRVNRTIKYKNDCNIVDFSYKNVNKDNIKQAYEHFSDVVVSDFDPLGEIDKMGVVYKELLTSSIYSDYFLYFSKFYNEKNHNPNKFMDLEHSFSLYIESSPEKSKELKQKINKYFHILILVEYIVDFDKKYSEPKLLKFFEIFNDTYNKVNNVDASADDVSVYFDNQIGIVNLSEDKPIKPHKPPSSGEDGLDSEGYKYEILAIIAKRNQENADIGALIDEFQQKIDDFFIYVKNHSGFRNLSAKMNATHFGEDEIYLDFRKIYNSFIRRHKNQEWQFFNDNTKDLIEKLCNDFEKYIELPIAQNNTKTT